MDKKVPFLPNQTKLRLAPVERNLFRDSLMACKIADKRRFGLISPISNGAYGN